ncbi:MAG: P-II family nitrogen regulator [Nitrososphaerota archaeon]
MVKFLIRIDIVVPRNDVQAISDALKRIEVGGITAITGWGRGKSIAPTIDSAKETETLTPEFGVRFILQVVVPDNKKNDVIKIVRENSKMGKIFASSISEAVDITTGNKDEKAI